MRDANDNPLIERAIGMLTDIRWSARCDWSSGERYLAEISCVDFDCLLRLEANSGSDFGD